MDFRLGSELTIYTVDQLGDEVISFPSKKSTVPASNSGESYAEARLDDSRLTLVRIGRQVTLS